jgi:hypothetical protein
MEKGKDSVLQCFVCGEPAAAYGCININGSEPRRICKACFNDPDTIVPKLLGVPDMVVEDGGKASPEEIREIADAMLEMEHSTVH